jgi:predicted DNA-binding transcriptional regulator YafY
MLETSARLLRLLALVQARRDWPGAELAGRLEVSPRTVRRDVGKLRLLGYPINAAGGVGGGYQPAAGASAVRDHRRLRFGSDSLDHLAVWVAAFGFEFEVHEPPELVEHLRTLTARLHRAAWRDSPASAPAGAV